jgi:hypothetical protein
MHNSTSIFTCSVSCLSGMEGGLAYFRGKRQETCRGTGKTEDCGARLFALAKAGELSDWYRADDDWQRAVAGMQVTFRCRRSRTQEVKISLKQPSFSSATAWWRRQALARPEAC